MYQVLFILSFLWTITYISVRVITMFHLYTLLKKMFKLPTVPDHKLVIICNYEPFEPQTWILVLVLGETFFKTYCVDILQNKKKKCEVIQIQSIILNAPVQIDQYFWIVSKRFLVEPSILVFIFSRSYYFKILLKKTT